MHIYKFKPYKTTKGMWTFKTPIKEFPHLPNRSEEDNALVAGIDVMLDTIARTLGKFELTFSSQPIEGNENNPYTMTLKWSHGNTTDKTKGGNYYIDMESELIGWLCPVLFDYFPVAPKFLYIVANPIK